MADLAIGISKAAVEALVNKVQSAIKEEAEKWRTVQRDLVFIMDEFEMMQSFLNSGDWERVKNNNVVRTWVRQVRTLSNDVEDCIEFVIHLDTKKRTWWLQLLPLPSCGKAEAASGLDQAVAEIAQLKARVVDVSQRSTRYSLISDSGSKPQETATVSASTRDILSKMKGGLTDLEGLITREDKDLLVISVCGTKGDVGKIGIVRKVYSDSTIYDKFECRAWLKLTHPFNPHEFIRSSMTQFYMNSCKEQEDVIVGLHAMNRVQATQQDDLLKEFAQKVSTHRYLIVLEDLNTMVEWDAIRSYLPDRKKRSRIVLLTHQPVIASLCTGEPCRVSELMQFSEGNPVHVYSKEVSIFDPIALFLKDARLKELCQYGLIGRDTEVGELLELTQENRLISVWGMPGVGKSVLMRAIWHHKRQGSVGVGKLAVFGPLLHKLRNFARHAWVSVGHPFDPTQFSLSLLVDLDSLSGAQLAGDPIKECQNLLESRCLIIIDGLQSKEDWEWIKTNFIQYGHSKSRIIVVTSDECVAKHCAVSSNGAVYKINGLQADAAIELFKKVIIEEKGSHLEEQMQEAAERLILSKCGGFPKLIVTLATYLATKPRDVVRQEMRRLSDNFMHEIETNPELDSLRVLPAWMHYYVDSCPQALKKCMLYLSIFPQDKIIRRRRLIRRWIAEGYSKGSHDGKIMEEYAEKLFNEVAAALSSIMQPVVIPKKSSWKVVGYRVNGFFREYILSRPVEETSFFPVEVSALGEGHGHLTTTEGVGQHLAFERIPGLHSAVLQSLDLTRLRSFTQFASGVFVDHVHDACDRMRVLRVLDLEGTDTYDFHLQEIGKLPASLKFLSLRGNRHISCLPDSLALGDLMQLQTLDIRDTSIVRLPPCIIRLRNLQYLRAGTTTATWIDDDDDDDDDYNRDLEEQLTTTSCWAKIRSRGLVGPPRRCGGSGVELPRGIRELKAMQTLGVVHAFTADGDDTLHEICDLIIDDQMKKLQVSGICSSTKSAERLSSIFFLKHLESLSLQFEKNNHFADRNRNEYSIILPTGLRSLEMYGHVQQLPRSTGSLAVLTKLALQKTTLLTPEDIQVLGNLPSLRTLRLRVNKGQHGELQFSGGLFSKLQDLQIMCESRLHVKFDQGATEKLQVLNVRCSHDGSSMHFSGLEYLKSLKLVWVHGSFDDALKDALERQLHENPRKPALELKQQERRSPIQGIDIVIN